MRLWRRSTSRLQRRLVGELVNFVFNFKAWVKCGSSVADRELTQACSFQITEARTSTRCWTCWGPFGGSTPPITATALCVRVPATPTKISILKQVSRLHVLCVSWFVTWIRFCPVQRRKHALATSSSARFISKWGNFWGGLVQWVENFSFYRIFWRLLCNKINFVIMGDWIFVTSILGRFQQLTPICMVF